MIAHRFSVFFFLILLSGVSSLSAQFFGGGSRNGSNNIIGVAGSASPGRVITVGGRLTPYRKVEHTATVDGYVDAILVKQGDRVKVGTPLIRISRDVVGETYLPVVVESRIDGIVSDIQVYQNQLVTGGTAAVTILDDRYYVLDASLSDRDAFAVRKLEGLTVQGKTPEGEAFPGIIESLSTEPDYTTGLFTLTMDFPRTKDLFLGAVLFVDLPVEKPSGITVDKTAVLSQDGSSFIWIINQKSELEKRVVTTGPEKDDSITVIKGIESGERYLRKPAGKEKEGMSLREFIQASMAAGGASGAK